MPLMWLLRLLLTVLSLLLGRKVGLLAGDLGRVLLLVRGLIQLEKTNSKNRFSVLEDEESMEFGAPPSGPSSPTPEHRGKSPPHTLKPQRTKSKN